MVREGNGGGRRCDGIVPSSDGIRKGEGSNEKGESGLAARGRLSTERVCW